MDQQLTQYQITGISRKTGRKRKKKYLALNEEEVKLKAEKDEIETLSISRISDPIDYENKLLHLSKNNFETTIRNEGPSFSVLDFIFGCSTVWGVFQIVNLIQGV